MQGVEWLVEVDYDSSWCPYGPVLPNRYAAEALVRELEKHGRSARLVTVQAATASASAAAAAVTQAQKVGAHPARRPKRRHGRPR